MIAKSIKVFVLHTLLLVSSALFSQLSISKQKTVLRFLEGNSWQAKFGELELLIDPVMSQLDFGIPFLYSGNKKYLDGSVELSNLSRSANAVLITQNFDDHAHTPTLKKLSKLNPKMVYICPPAAKSILTNCGILEKFVTTISPGQTVTVSQGPSTAEIIATQGALLGPPWQQKENGYVIRPKTGFFFPSVYIEPHCMYDEEELKNYEVDCVISPVVSQELPAYTLVAGGPKAVRLAKILKARCIAPMANGDLSQSGILSKIISEGDSFDTFKVLATKNGIRVLDIAPGNAIEI